MTEIVFRPEPGAGVAEKRTLYRAFVNRKPIGLLVRAKNAAEADELVQWLFENETRGKTLVADMTRVKEKDDGNENK